MKRVSLDLQPCAGNRSGIGMYTYEIAKRVKSDNELEFSGNLFNFRNEHEHSQWISKINIPVYQCHLLPYHIYRLMWEVFPLDYRRLFSGKSDLTVFFNYLVPPRIKGKVITTVHDVTYLRYPETVKARTLYSLRWRLRRSIERSDHILTVSEFTKRELQQLLNIPEEKISVIPNAAVFSENAADFGDVSKKYGFDGPYILYVGTVEPRKNLVRLLHAFEQLKTERNIPHCLVLAGGNGWNNADIYQAAKDSKYADQIHFTGYVTEEEKSGLYRHADVFVFPSLYEGFGIPPLEAMHWGCPVVTSNAASLPEVVGDAAELVDPFDETDIARGIWNILSDEAYASELVDRGKRQAEKFTWEDSAKKLTEICRKVLNER